jgi:thymidylate synthase (FAD)
MKPSVSLVGLTVPAEAWFRYSNSPLAATIPTVPIGDNPETIVELAGRYDYGLKSIAKLGDLSIIRRWLNQGEESMIEMLNVVMLVECSRVVSHELVRHRLASYQQASQRFISYEDASPEEMFYWNDDEFGERKLSTGEINPMWLHFLTSLATYKRLRALKVPKQFARYVLPNSTATQIVVNMNDRAWRHVMQLRLHTSAQPEMREVMRQIHAILVQLHPTIFADILELVESGRAAR